MPVMTPTVSPPELLPTLAAPGSSSTTGHNPLSETPSPAPGSSSTTGQNPLSETPSPQLSSKKHVSPSPKRARASASQLARELSVLDALRKRLQRKYEKMRTLSLQ